MMSNYWLDRPGTGDYCIDCIIGRGIADQVIRDMQERNFPPLLGDTAFRFFRDTPTTEPGGMDGRIVGFFQGIAERAAFWPESTAG